jgi:hypothetical protein
LSALVDRVDSMPARGNYSEGSYDGIDAVGHLQNPEINPGETAVVVAHVQRSKETCYADGGGIFFSDSPVLRVSSLGISGDRASGSVRFGFEGTKDSFDPSCNKGAP